MIDWLQFIDSVILRVNIKLDIPEETNESFLLLAILLSNQGSIPSFGQ